MTIINYISELNLPSNSGYSQHVLKICDAFAEKKKTKLFVYSKKINFEELKKNYLLKKKFKIHAFKKKNLNLSFLRRINYARFIIKNLDNNCIIISRSPITSFFLSLFNRKNILELHHPLKGLSKFIFKIFRILRLDKSITYLLLHQNLKKELKIKKALVLDDAVDYRDFIKIKSSNNREFTYTGSLFSGKGLEIIVHLAKKFPKKKFHVFGDTSKINQNKFDINNIKKIRNLLFHGHLIYQKIPKILKSSKFLLMPYSNKVNVNSNNLDVSKFMSPLKMFDYLSAGKIIIASDLKVYSHILKNNFNCVLAKSNNFKDWEKKIISVIKNKKKNRKLKRNAILTAKRFTWIKRTTKIIDYYEKKKFD